VAVPLLFETLLAFGDKLGMNLGWQAVTGRFQRPEQCGNSNVLADEVVDFAIG
jgi:hypothetical protein